MCAAYHKRSLYGNFIHRRIGTFVHVSVKQSIQPCTPRLTDHDLSTGLDECVGAARDICKQKSTKKK